MFDNLLRYLTRYRKSSEVEFDNRMALGGIRLASRFQRGNIFSQWGKRRRSTVLNAESPIFRDI